MSDQKFREIEEQLSAKNKAFVVMARSLLRDFAVAKSKLRRTTKTDGESA